MNTEVIDVESEVNVEAPIRWDEPIVTGPLLTPTGREIKGMVGVFGRGGNVYLGKYSAENKVVPNVNYINTFEEALGSMGFTFEREIHLFDNGARMLARYTIRKLNVNGPDGKPLVIRIDLKNSYNGIWTLGGDINLLRLVCLNGCVAFGRAFSINQRHSGKVDVSSIVQTLAPQIETAGAGLVNNLNLLSQKNISFDDGFHILRNMSKLSHGKFSGRLARKIEENWAHPTEDESSIHGNLYGLYNAGTRLFRDLENEKSQFDLVNRSGTHFGMALLQSTQKPDWFKQLTVPITEDEAYSRAE